MELEQRVKALEYEIKILKNEIQRALLDVQEQVLNNYYPSAPSGAGTPSNVAPPISRVGLSATPAPVAKPGSVPEVRSTPNDTTRPPLSSGGTMSNQPVVKKVTLDEIRAVQAAATALAQPAAAVQQPVEPPNVVKLLEWIVSSVARIGGKRTIKIIDVYAKKGIITPEVRATLLQVASLSKDAGPEKVAVNEVLDNLLKLNALLSRPADIEEALTLIEEANLG